MISQITSVWGAPAPHQSTNLQTRVKLCPIEGEGEKKKKKNKKEKKHDNDGV